MIANSQSDAVRAMAGTVKDQPTEFRTRGATRMVSYSTGKMSVGDPVQRASWATSADEDNEHHMLYMWSMSILLLYVKLQIGLVT